MKAPELKAWHMDLARGFVGVALAFSAAYLLYGAEGAPGGSMFALLTIFIVASLFGTAIGNLKMNLSPLLGMLIAGLVLRNTPHLGEHIGSRVDPEVSSAVRDIALALILSRAGLGLDLSVLNRMKWVILRLAFLPNIAEALTVATFATVLLDFPWEWALMLGFLWSAISPAVLVPSLLSLFERGYGVESGIVPATICAAPLDDVCSITAFSILLDFAMGHDTVSPDDFAVIPLQVVMGVGVGAVGAAILVFISPVKEGEDASLTGRRMWLLVGFAVVSLVGLKRAGFSGCAALAVVVLALGAGKGWGKEASKKVSGPLTQLWNMFAQPLLFGLVGVEVVFADLDMGLVGSGLALVCVGLCARFLVAFLSMSFLNLTWKEKLFTALSLMPKATVQAAIGGIPRSEAMLIEPRDAEALHKIDMANTVLRLSVLIIILTAPLGAMIIMTMGPKLLKRDGVDASGGTVTLVPDLEEPSPDVIEKVRTGARRRTLSALPSDLIGNEGDEGAEAGGEQGRQELLKRAPDAGGDRAYQKSLSRRRAESMDRVDTETAHERLMTPGNSTPGSRVRELEEPTPAVIEEVMRGRTGSSLPPQLIGLAGAAAPTPAPAERRLYAGAGVMTPKSGAQAAAVITPAVSDEKPGAQDSTGQVIDAGKSGAQDSTAEVVRERSGCSI